MSVAFYVRLSCNVALVLCLSAVGLAQTARVSGTIALSGPPRSLELTHVSLRYMSLPINASSDEAQKTHPSMKGTFEFENVKPGIYLLQVDGPGILRAQWGALGPQLSGRALVIHRGDNITELTVPVTSRPILCGTVFGLDGKPLAEASVHAWKTDPSGTEMSMSSAGPGGLNEGGGNATADADGRYRFNNFKPDLYILGAYLPDISRTELNQSPVAGFWKDASDPSQAKVINLTATGVPDSCPYDLHLKQIPKPYDGPRYRVEGTLSTASPVLVGRHLEWELTPLSRPLRDFTGGRLPFNAASPVFNYAGVPPGRYRLSLAVSSLMSFSGSCEPFTPTYASQEITVTGDLLDIRVDLWTPVVVQGKVEEIMTPVDRPSSRTPTGTYYVALTKKGNCATTNAAPDGTFSFSSIDPGDYKIDVSLPIYGLYTWRVEQNGATASDGLVHLNPGLNTLRILNRFDYGTVKGKVQAKTADGAPALDENNNWLGGDEYVLILGEHGSRFNSSVSAVHGMFRVPLAPGHYTVIAGTNQALKAWADRDWDEPFLKKLVALGTTVEVKPNEQITVTLPDETIAIQNLMADFRIPLSNY